MRFTTFAILVALAPFASDALAKPSSIAVLPLDAVGDATGREVDFLGPVLRKALRSARIRIVRGNVVTAALAEHGATRSSDCDTACLVSIGKTLTVDRVIAPSLELQRKFTHQGTAWTLTLRQVDVTASSEWGTFSKLCLCAKKTWEAVTRELVRQAMEHDPKTVLNLPTSAPTAQVSTPPFEVPAMVYVPAGPFIMGTERGEWNDEAPRHQITLSDYFIGRTEVSNADYQKCVDAKRCVPGRYSRHAILGKPNHPIAGPNWHDATAYCKFVGQRLPTEAEWEKAARGTDERIFPWGNVWDPKKLNRRSGDDGFEMSAPVGSFPEGASPYGALDMAGNQWEWTADVYSSIGYRHHEADNPKGPKRGRKRAMRGGSWMYNPSFFHSAHNRSPGRPEVRKKYVGFRCARDADMTPK